MENKGMETFHYASIDQVKVALSALMQSTIRDK